SDLSLVPVWDVILGQGAGLLSKPLGLPESDFLLMDLPRGNVHKIATILDRFLITEDVEIRDVTDRLGCLSLQGPRADPLWEYDQGMPDDPLQEDWPRLYCMPADYTGMGGVNVYFPMEEKAALLERVRHRGGVEVGEEAQEILRVEAGIPKYGIDMDESVIALE